MSLLRVRHLTKSYDAEHEPAVEDVVFDVAPGEIFVLLGPSGCGKTTALRLIAGFEHADRGYIVLNDKPLTFTPGCPGPLGIKPRHIRPEKRGIGFVFQDYALFPHMNVLKNVMYGLKRTTSKRKMRALEALDMVGMKEFAYRRPHELSGGQQQRVALARSIAPEPSLILLDEPFSNLDAGLRESTRQEVRKLLHEQNMAAILVTHDQEEALSFADRIAVMDQGRIVQVGEPDEVYEHPSSAFTAQFLGRTNLLDVKAERGLAKSPLGLLQLYSPGKSGSGQEYWGDSTSAQKQIEAGAAVDGIDGIDNTAQSHLKGRPIDPSIQGDVRVSLRPEHLAIEEPHKPGCRGEVLSREYKGHDLTYRVKIDDDVLIVQTDYRCRFVPGDRVCVRAIEKAVVVEC
jgi:iron(III) transport system ATP-binding protein